MSKPAITVPKNTLVLKPEHIVTADTSLLNVGSEVVVDARGNPATGTVAGYKKKSTFCFVFCRHDDVSVKYCQSGSSLVHENKELKEKLDTLNAAKEAAEREELKLKGELETAEKKKSDALKATEERNQEIIRLKNKAAEDLAKADTARDVAIQKEREAAAAEKKALASQHDKELEDERKLSAAKLKIDFELMAKMVEEERIGVEQLLTEKDNHIESLIARNTKLEKLQADHDDAERQIAELEQTLNAVAAEKIEERQNLEKDLQAKRLVIQNLKMDLATSQKDVDCLQAAAKSSQKTTDLLAQVRQKGSSTSSTTVTASQTKVIAKDERGPAK